MIPRYVIYHVASGVIVAVLTGKRSFAEVNLREGEAIVEHLRAGQCRQTPGG